ncbi:monovalent cation/H(+) antiporter subunit G [Agathobaculum sp. NTUH-O15-33]|uniref:cation:proton antiporter n=1 Tax=Agathobaculum sp. NTUH-O15-33 TaxID=3079302 RepID=UPI002958C732|nr:monovalent cation/H(+) antiporter subunit G [Agathobaculum sp. NTUH-O15-33]WNX86238.1 monovalent cation/H(+) antiporter subunit G [Agathobaculum sp. NTUH-O15-33]
MIDNLFALLAALLMLAGAAIMVIGTIGVFRFRFVLSRMHAAAMNDTLGILFILLGLSVRCGFTFATLKLLLVIGFFWMASPVSSHLLGKLEVNTNENLSKECEIVDERNH